MRLRIYAIEGEERNMEINKFKNASETNLLKRVITFVEKEFDKDSNKYMKINDIPLADTEDNTKVRNMQLEKFFIDLKVQNVSNHFLGNEQSHSYKERDSGNGEGLDFVKTSLKVLDELEQVPETKESIEKNKRNWLLKGSAGQGKSTLIQFISRFLSAHFLLQFDYVSNSLKNMANEFLEASSKFNNNFQNEFCIPIRIILSEYEEYIAKQSNSSFQTIIHYILYLILGKNEFDLYDELWDYLMQQKVIILLDGFDEIKQRQDFIKSEIDRLSEITSCKGSRILVITSTRREISSIFSERDYSIFYILELEEDAVEEFVEQYSNKFSYDKSVKRKFLNEILTRYKEDSDVRGLMRTPLEVTLICLVRDTTLKIPSTRIGLYTDYLNVYITRAGNKTHEKFGFLKDEEKGNYVRTILYRMGYECIINNCEAFTEEKILELIKEENRMEGGQVISNWVEESSQRIKETIIRGLGIMEKLDSVDNTYSIINHASFKEFLAAKYIESFCDDGDNNLILKLLYNIKFSLVLKFVLEIYRIKNNGKRIGIIIPNIAKPIDETRKYLHLIESNKISAYHAARIFSFKLFTDKPFFQEILINETINLLEMDTDEGDKNTINIILDYLEQATEGTRNATYTILLNALATKRKLNNWYNAYESLITQGLINNYSSDPYECNRFLLQRYLLHYNECYNESTDLINYITYFLREFELECEFEKENICSVNEYLPQLIEEEIKKKQLVLSNNFIPQSLYQLYLMEIIRFQLNQKVPCDVLRYLALRWFGFGPMYKEILIKVDYKFIFEYKVKGDKKTPLFFFRVASIKNTNSKKICKRISELCFEHGFPAFGKIFSLMAEFNFFCLKSFLTELYNDKFTEEIKNVLGEINTQKYSNILDHPVFSFIYDYIEKKLKYNLNIIENNFELFLGKRKLNNMQEMIELSQQLPLYASCKNAKRINGDGNFIIYYYDLFAKILNILNSNSTNQKAYLEYLFFIFSMNEWHLHLEEDEQGLKNILENLYIQYLEETDNLNMILDYFLENLDTIQGPRRFCNIINFMLSSPKKELFFDNIKRIDFLKNKKNIESYYIRMLRRTETSTFRKSSYIKKVIEGIFHIMSTEINFGLIYYYELLFLSLVNSRDYICQSIVILKMIIDRYKAHNYVPKLLEIILLIEAWAQGSIETLTQNIIDKIRECSNNYPVVNSWMTFEIFFDFLQSNYKEVVDEVQYNDLINTFSLNIPSGVQYLGTRQKSQKYLLSVINSLEFDLIPNKTKCDED